jgi:hypothetical protein
MFDGNWRPHFWDDNAIEKCHGFSVFAPGRITELRTPANAKYIGGFWWQPWPE